MDEDDDPTRALDGFAHRLPPQATAAELTDLSDLLGRIAPDRAVPRHGKGGTLRDGQTWNADDVVDVPLVQAPRAVAPQIDLPDVTRPMPTDSAGAEAACRTASDLAAAQDPRCAAPDWQPEPARALARPSDPRLLAAWKPGAWSGAVREVFDAVTEFVTTPDGPAVETYPPHRLLALWPPQGLDAPLLSRWPQQVRLSAVDAGDAGDALLRLLPPDAELWLIHADIDWALVAELVLHHDPGLRPFQLKGLRAFVETEREVDFARLNADYQLGAAGGDVEHKLATPRR